VVVCEECQSENTWYHETDCPNYVPIRQDEINASLLREPERDALRLERRSEVLRASVVAATNGHNPRGVV